MKKKKNCMPSIGNMEGHWDICSAGLAAKCFSKEAGAVLFLSSFDYLVSVTALYETVQGPELLKNTQTAQQGSKSTAEVYVSYYLLTADCILVFQKTAELLKKERLYLPK